MFNTINSVVNNSVGKLTNKLIIDGLRANPNMSGQQLSQTLGVSMKDIASALSEDAQRLGYQTTTIGNAETGQSVSNIRDLGAGFNAYQDENGQTSGFSRVDPSRPGMIQLYGPNGEFRGEQKITSTTQDMLKTLGPIALAAGGSALASYLGAAGTTPFAGEALADANLLSGGTNLSSLTSTGAPFAGEALADANLLSNTGAGSAFEAANAGASANTIGGTTAANAATTANAANTASKFLTPTNALALSALGNVVGGVATQEGISNARDLINQYGTKAADVLGTTYKDQLAAAAANRGDLSANYGDLNTKLSNTLNAQTGLYGATKSDLASNYANTTSNLYDIYNKQVGIQQPYQNVGINASNELVENTPYFTRQFTNADLNANLAPNYAFQLEQGQMANRRMGNLSGGAMGGNAMQGLQRYTQDYAGGAYQNAFTNFQNQRQNIYNTLAGMANIGQTSTGQLVNLGNTLGGNLGSLSSNYGSNMLSNANQLQGAYNQFGSNLTNASNTYGGNLTTGTGQVINAGNAYGLNASNLYSNLASATGSNAVASGVNTANTLNNLGNTALLSSLIKTA